MNFSEAYQKMLEGKKAKRPDWKGYWFIENDKVKIKFAGGEIKENRFTQQTIKNTAADDWEVYEEPKSKVWKPKSNDTYYCLVSTGEVECTSYSQNHRSDEDRVILGNCFETKEEADHMVEKLKVIKELKELSNIKFNMSDYLKNNKIYYIAYDFTQNRIVPLFDNISRNIPFNVYFSTKEDCEKAITKIGKERLERYYFDMED